MAQSSTNFSCLYFGYASNLSSRTLQQRCPGALYVGLAVLPGWKFIISELGFGNIVPSADPSDLVYGSLHFLTAQHEAALDKSEEVPDWHQKRSLKVKMIAEGSGGSGSGSGSGSGEEQWREGREVEATCYIDTVRTREGRMWKEYIVWMRKAVEDGLHLGVPPEYFERYVAKYLPEESDVGREEKIIMLRTIEHDRNDLRFVPSWFLDKEK